MKFFDLQNEFDKPVFCKTPLISYDVAALYSEVALADVNYWKRKFKTACVFQWHYRIMV